MYVLSLLPSSKAGAKDLILPLHVGLIDLSPPEEAICILPYHLIAKRGVST